MDKPVPKMPNVEELDALIDRIKDVIRPLDLHTAQLVMLTAIFDVFCDIGRVTGKSVEELREFLLEMFQLYLESNPYVPQPRH